VEDIINYDNGKLLQKAKSKVLFLAFCMEFSSFYQFMCDESLDEFKTSLPIQLDATCNGFQHLAFLSNEKKLFEELNIQKSTEKEEPGDLYNYILIRLDVMIQDKLQSDSLDPKLRANYERLHRFVWSRSDIKKAIMTIPYNATKRTISDYIKDSLEYISTDIEKLEDKKYIKRRGKKVLITEKKIN
jgi:DNA-directed RNA polymerase